MEPFMKHITLSRSITPAGRLLVLGHILILAALCDFAARFAVYSPEHMLYLESFMGSISSATVLLWGAYLLWEWTEAYRSTSKPQ
jgi:hypothetical protein